jgi:hypothetical protein
MAGNPDGRRELRLTRKEWVMLIFPTALALGSFKTDDPWVVVPMLCISGASFVLLCIWHQGRRAWRVFAASVLVAALSFIGWRDLHHQMTTAQPAGTPAGTNINQTSTDSDCSNLVAGSDSRIKCEAEKERHEKDDVSH